MSTWVGELKLTIREQEARVEDYDAASSTVMLRATKLSSVPLDGRFVASEEDRAALYETTVNLAWDQLVDVRYLSCSRSCVVFKTITFLFADSLRKALGQFCSTTFFHVQKPFKYSLARNSNCSHHGEM